LLQSFYLAQILDRPTTTFEVNVTVCDLVNSFIFDSDAQITSHVCFVIYV